MSAVPWDLLPESVVAHVLYCLCYTYHERDKVYEIWRVSRFLQQNYTPWFREAFQQRHVYRIWCVFLRAPCLMASHLKGNVHFMFTCLESNATFFVKIQLPVPMRYITQAHALPIVYDDDDDKHQHKSMKTITFAMDGELFFLRFERYSVRESCACFPVGQTFASQLCAVVTHVSTCKDRDIHFTIKWAK